MSDNDTGRSARGCDFATSRVPAGNFPPTRWSVVLAAKHASSPEGARALETLCRIYWHPAYFFLRRQGRSPQDAEDLTQGFFASILQRGSLATVEEAKGRLRSFLLVALKRFAAGEHERAMMQKRGGGIQHVSIDAQTAEERYVAEPVTHLTPELLFERQWAVTLLDTVLKKLRAEYARDGREVVFDALKDRLSADGDPATLGSVAGAIAMNEGAVKVALHRLRQRYRRVLNEEIAFTVDSPEEVQEEIVHLFKVFGAVA
jgi:DNA-directed RNA polymerase specialized sigma24 family protein